MLIYAGLADTNGATGKNKRAQHQHGPWGEPETLTLFNEESGHLVAAAEDNQP